MREEFYDQKTSICLNSFKHHEMLGNILHLKQIELYGALRIAEERSI